MIWNVEKPRLMVIAGADLSWRNGCRTKPRN